MTSAINFERLPKGAYTLRGARFPEVYKFECRGKTFYAHHAVNTKAQVCVGCWQFSHEQVPVSYIPGVIAEMAIAAFMEYADMLGERFDDRLKEVVAENLRRFEHAGP